MLAMNIVPTSNATNRGYLRVLLALDEINALPEELNAAAPSPGELKAERRRRGIPIPRKAAKTSGMGMPDLAVTETMCTRR